MNERIKELAKQSGFVLWSDEEWKPEGAVVDWSSNYDNELAKFAELIVRECIEEFRGEVQHWYDWEVDDEMLEQVNKHFGVEE